MRNQSGFTLIELLIVASMMIVVCMGAASVLASQMDALKNLENKSTFESIGNDIDMVLAEQKLCENAFRAAANVNQLYDPAADTDQPYSVDVRYMYAGNQVMLAGKGLDGPVQLVNKLTVNTLRLSRVTGMPTTMTFVEMADGTSVAVQRHIARLELEVTRVGGHMSGTPFKKSWLVALFVSPVLNRVVTCQAKVTARLEQAIATRTGQTAELKGCTETVPTNLYRANPGCDGDGDGRCDSDNSLVQAAHPNYVQSPPNDLLWIRRDSGRSPLGSIAEEGRCPVEVLRNNSFEAPTDIFAMYNDSIDHYNGVGCKAAKGWILTGCVRSDQGTGDADTIIKSINGVEYCYTNDWSQPHRDNGKIFSAKAITLTVFCTKME